MANEIGAALQIPDSVFAQITKAEERIKRLEQTARDSSDKINKAFMSLGEVGLANFLKRLKETQTEIGKFDVSKILSGAQGMANVSAEAGAAAASVTQAAVAMNQMGERTYSTTKNLAELTAERKKLTKELTKGEGLSLAGGEQHEAVNSLEEVNRAIKEQLKGQKQLAEEAEKAQIKAIKEEQKQDNIRYQAWLKNKHDELIEEQRVEREKQRTKKANIEAYLKSLEELRKKQAQWAEESLAAKNSGEVINKARREQERAYEQMFDKIEERRKRDMALAQKAAEAEKRAVASLYQQQNYKKNTSYQGALSFAENANTINRRVQAIKYLTAARAQLSTTDANYAQKLKALNDAIKRMNAENNKAVEGSKQLQKQHNNLMNTSEQLARKLALIFSVSQITGYIKAVARVRGEFELQNTALASILQNKDQADKLFGQITELAVKSPFTLKELTTYTKSLSAYQVEYEKLYDTTKMLADVSAGLGVDMQRLILAFGQVKAANFLRGCLGYGTPILLYDGTIKQVQDIKVGDVLINEKGEAVNVLELIRGRETMYLVEQVTGRDRFSYRVNRNHILTLWNVQNQRLEDVYVYDYLRNTEAYLGLKIVDGEKVYYDIEVTRDRIDDYYGFVLDGNKRFRLGDGTITHNTETRQFSEAGLNILGELSKYYSELEGRVVSLSEVQERQYKRMIKFQDVEEVFKRVTSAGGMFYQMQERQAETLAGQMSNLQDSIDIMLNDIGKANEGILKGVVAALRDVINNWDKIADIAIPLLPLVLSLATATKTWGKAMGSASMWGKNIGANFKAAMLSARALGAELRGVNTAQREFNKSAALNGWLMIGTAVLAIIMEVQNAIKNANKVQNELNRLSSEGFYNSEESARNYVRLADTVADSTKSYEEQEKALEELKRTYGEILPQHYLEADAIRAMKGSYDEATAAIKNYMLAKTQEKQLQFLSEEYNDDITKAQENLTEYTKGILESYYDIKLSTQEATVVMTKFREELEKGLIKTPEEARTKLEQLFSDFLKQDISLSFVDGTFLNLVPITDYFNKIVEYKGKVDDVLAQTNASWADRITLQFQDMRKNLQSQMDEVNAQLNIISKEGQIGKDGGLITKEQVSLAKDRIKEIASAWGIEASKIEKLTGGAFEIKRATVEYNRAALKAFYKEVANMSVTASQHGSKAMFLQQIQAEIDKLDATPFQRYVEQIIFENAKLNNISLNGLVDAFASANEGVSDYSKRIAEQAKRLQEQLALFATSPYLVPEWGGDANMAKQAEKILRVYQVLAKATSASDDKKKKKSDNDANKRQQEALRLLKERIELLKKAGDTYEEFLKYYDKEAAKQKTRDYLKDAAKDLKIQDIVMTMDVDISGVISAISNISNTAGKEGKKAIDEAVNELTKEKEIKFKEEGLDAIQEKMDKLFSSYDFNLELQTSGVDTNAMRNFLKDLGATDDTMMQFGLDTTTLEELQKKVRAEMARLQQEGGEDSIKYAKQLQEKLTVIEMAAAQKKYDELMRLREKYQTNEDKIAKEKTRLQGLEAEKAAIEAGLKQVSDEQKELIDYQIKESNDMIRQLESEALQLTDFWKQLFGDLENLSVSSLRRLVKMSDEVLANAKEVIEDGELKGYQSYYIDKDKNKKDVTLTTEQYQRLLKKSSEVSNQIADKNPFIALYDAAKDGRKEGETTLDYIERLKNYMDKAIEVAAELADNLATIFGGDEDVKQTISDIMSAVKGAEEFGVGIAQIANGDILGGVRNATSGMAKVVSSINSIFDRGKEKEIERQLELVEDLQRAYDKLEEAIDSAYTIDTYNASYENAISNLEKQNEALQKAINAERDKKDTDDDRIKEWQQQMEDNMEQIQELQEQYINSLGGFGSEANVKSAAEEFAEAWLDAFMETGDGLDALKEKWNEYIQNVVAKQLMLKGTEKYLKPIMDLLDRQLEDSQFTQQEASEIQDKIDEVMPLLNEYWKAIAGSFKLPTQAETGELSGLQKGIESITEETAQALESLLNSIRYFVADTNAQVNNLYRFFTGTPEESPLMQELRMQTRYLGNINTLVASVIKTTTGKGKVLRVELV